MMNDNAYLKTRIRREVFPAGRRVLMISDLHGHAEGLKSLLERASFCEDDILVIVGDFVEKGPEILETVRYVMQLCEKYTVYPVMGNVDSGRLQGIDSDDPEIHRRLIQYALYARRWWGNSLHEEMYRECGFSVDEEHDVGAALKVLRRHFAKELGFLKSLPTILETQNMIFVHGGIPHERLNELEGTPSHLLMKRDHFMDEGLSFEKYVAVGHWPVALYSKDRPCCDPVIDHRRHMISLDGGCGVRSDGQLNLLILPQGDVHRAEWLTWDPLPKIIAQEAQDASETSVYFPWDEDPVEVLENSEGMTRIRREGKEFCVPEAFLWERDGRTYCSNYTDYRVQANPGDRLSLVLTAPCGCYVKKNGVTGWYTGQYRNA